VARVKGNTLKRSLIERQRARRIMSAVGR